MFNQFTLTIMIVRPNFMLEKYIKVSHVKKSQTGFGAHENPKPKKIHKTTLKRDLALIPTNDFCASIFPYFWGWGQVQKLFWDLLT